MSSDKISLTNTVWGSAVIMMFVAGVVVGSVFTDRNGEGPPMTDISVAHVEGMAHGAGEAMPAEAGHGEGAVHVTLDEWSIRSGAGETTLAADEGEVALEVHNDGVVPHALSLIRTDLDPANLPIANGKVDEEAAGELVGTIEEFHGGQILVGSFALTPGNYALVCNIPGHYQQGMYTTLVVN